MKKIYYSSCTVALMLFSTCIAIYSFINYKNSFKDTNFDIEALAYSNEGPGAQGHRQTQAVWCGGGGWEIRSGCCYGGSNCTYIDCSTNSFSCDGNTWIDF